MNSKIEAVMSWNVKIRYFLSRKCRLRTVSRKNEDENIPPWFTATLKTYFPPWTSHHYYKCDFSARCLTLYFCLLSLRTFSSLVLVPPFHHLHDFLRTGSPTHFPPKVRESGTWLDFLWFPVSLLDAITVADTQHEVAGGTVYVFATTLKRKTVICELFWK